jgi:hypothetical protein
MHAKTTSHADITRIATPSTEGTTTMKTITFTTKGCTLALASDIHHARVRYAEERCDFHDFFDNLPVPRIQKILRGSIRPRTLLDRRASVVTRLLRAHREAPHRLWELLLVEAFEGTLVARRAALSTAVDPALDAAAVDTFLAALVHIPFAIDDDALLSFVTDLSAHLFSVATRDERAASPPPASGVSLLAATHPDSVDALNDDDASELR